MKPVLGRDLFSVPMNLSTVCVIYVESYAVCVFCLPYFT